MPETVILIEEAHKQETVKKRARRTYGEVVEYSHPSPIDIIEFPEITDPLFKHITETFTTHELVRQRCVSKAWKTLLIDNMLATDSSSCSYTKGSWYFPIRFKTDCSFGGGRHEHTWTWSGVHQPSGNTHSLPHIHIPNTLVEGPIPTAACGGDHQSPTSQLVCLAVAGSLILFGDDRPVITHDWKPLVVYNPLRGESRELPKVHTSDRSPHVVDMVVDETTLSYKVLLISRARVCTYKPSSNSWSEHRFSELVTWGLEGAARTFVGGKLHFAELDFNGPVMHNFHLRGARVHVSVFKVDEDAGSWEQSIRIALQDYIPYALNVFTHIWNHGMTAIALVECMGRLFALIPSFLDGNKTVKKETLEADKVPEQAGMRTYEDYGYLPLQFHVLPLDGGGVVGQLRTRFPYPLNTPRILNTFKKRLSSSFLLLFGLCLRKNYTLREMQCSARGSIIYVTYLDYLLQFDMLSGGSHTCILREFLSRRLPNLGFNRPHMAYSPSFHMKP